MTNRTQCPNCLTVYLITDEQYQKSKGKVRCGTCRQPFFAEFLPDNEPAQEPDPEHSSPTQGSNDDGRTVPDTERNLSSRDTSNAAGERKHDGSRARDRSTTDYTTPTHGADNLQSRDDPSPNESKPDRFSSVPDNQKYADHTSSQTTANNYNDRDSENTAPDLATQVEILVGKKILATKSATQTDGWSAQTETQTDSEPLVLDEPFYLDGRRPRGVFYRWIVRPLMALVVLVAFLVLAVVLMYQLWLRQAVPALESEALAEKARPYLEPITAALDEHFDFRLPVRRDLVNLRLLAARTEPHPSRPSTILLKVSIVNKSTIAQPFPWMELVLMDENGRLVSRRALAPDDYLHNNRVARQIRANELRQVTIELLSFPKQAHGYELRLLNK